MQDLPIVQQVEKLATIDLVEGDIHAQVAMLLVAQAPEDVLSRQQEYAGCSVLLRDALALLLVWAHHCEGLPAASLPVREARALGALEDGVNDWPDTSAIELLVTDRLIEGLVKEEAVLLHVAREVHLQLRLAHDDRAVPANHHILLLRLHLAPVHGPLADHDAQPRAPRPPGLGHRGPGLARSAAGAAPAGHGGEGAGTAKVRLERRRRSSGSRCNT
mmetsp:Transcript_124466/g.387532  ORF Transcript_124466/g.387532 Transcript_124466/m.387532 type:complete len:218 (-) Transcript_124466:122-775(-)